MRTPHVFRRKPLVICGPSGVGKGTITDILFASHPLSYCKAVSHTTRKPRKGELEGRDYYFVPHLEQMQHKIARGEFIEHAQVHGNLYGTSFSTLKNIDHVMNKVCVLDIDLAGLRQITQLFQSNAPLQYHHHHHLAHLYEPQPMNRVGIIPASLDQLEERLRGRKSETEESVQKRLAAAKEEIRAIREDGIVDHVIVNDDSWKVGYPSLEVVLKKWYPQVFKV